MTMIIYNVTTQVNWAIHEDWLPWMKAELIPRIMATGCFSNFRIVKLLEVDDSDGPTYAVQYSCDSPERFHEYVRQHAPKLRQLMAEKWGDQFHSFRSLMEVVN
jgi:hypothetical protein